MTRRIFAIFCILFPVSCSGVSFTTASPDPEPVSYTRGLYVDGFDSILGDTTKENTLLSFAQQNNITYLALYDLQAVWDQGGAINNFISKAKNTYGIEQVGAIGESTHFFDHAQSYNETYANTFDVLNLEYEYWNNDPTDIGNYITLLTYMQSIADAQGLLVEAYIGWPTESEMTQILSKVDRLLVHAYVVSPDHVADYVQERFSWIKAQSQHPVAWIIFSVEDEFMGPWEWAHSLDDGEDIVITGLETNAQDDLITGFQYFTYTLF